MKLCGTTSEVCRFSSVQSGHCRIAGASGSDLYVASEDICFVNLSKSHTLHFSLLSGDEQLKPLFLETSRAPPAPARAVLSWEGPACHGPQRAPQSREWCRGSTRRKTLTAGDLLPLPPVPQIPERLASSQHFSSFSLQGMCCREMCQPHYSAPPPQGVLKAL